MAEYLIQDTTLDAIADAINAKTGGSSSMTPAQMVTAIGSISGGGEKVYTKLAEAVVSEPVHTLDISFTEQMRNCEALYLVIDSIVLSESDWIYPVINYAQNYGYFDEASTLDSETVVFSPIKKPSGTYKTSATSSSYTRASVSKVINNFNTIGITCYNINVNITSGKIEVWGFV